MGAEEGLGRLALNVFDRCWGRFLNIKPTSNLCLSYLAHKTERLPEWKDNKH